MSVGRFVGANAGTGVSTNVSVSQIETPQTIAGLAAWFSARSSSHITLATGVSAWLSRAGSLGAVTLSQGITANQPAYVTSVASLGGRPAILFDGSNDSLVVSTASQWTFLHNGTGAFIFLVMRADSTGGATQRVFSSAETATEHGCLFQLTTTTARALVYNGSGTAASDLNSSTSALFARDVSRWQAWDYSTAGGQDLYVSGATATQAAGSPSATAPSRAFRVGANASSGSAFKGWISEIIIYAGAPSASDRAALASWANREYGVAV